MGPSKVLTTLFLQVQYIRQLSLLKLTSCFFRGSSTFQHCYFLYGPSCMNTSTVRSGLSANAAPTFAYKHSILLPSYVFGCCYTPPASSSDSLRVLQQYAGGLRARSAKLLHLSSSCRLYLYPGMRPQLIFLFLDSLPFVFIAPMPSLAFFLLMTRTQVLVSSLSSGRTNFSLNSFLALSLFAWPLLLTM